MSTPLYKQAAEALRVLQGITPNDTLSNTEMGCNKVADQISEYFKKATLIKARTLLDEEQGLQPMLPDQPVECTRAYGEQTKAWLERQQTQKQAVKHPMVTDEPAKVDDVDIVAGDLSTFLGKALPDDPQVRLAMWVELKELASKAKVLEMELRKSLSTHFFPTPKEGANNLKMNGGWKLTNKHTINRKLDVDAFDEVFEKMYEGAKDDLIKYTPELKIKAYRQLSDKERNIFDNALVIKNGSPELKLVAPKKED